MEDKLVIAGKTFNSRLMVGTGKYRKFDEMIIAMTKGAPFLALLCSSRYGDATVTC